MDAVLLAENAPLAELLGREPEWTCRDRSEGVALWERVASLIRSANAVSSPAVHVQGPILTPDQIPL
jgi:hypothetical protein